VIVIAITLFDDVFQHFSLVVWKVILKFHQGPHMVTIYKKNNKQTVNVVV